MGEVARTASTSRWWWQSRAHGEGRRDRLEALPGGACLHSPSPPARRSRSATSSARPAGQGGKSASTARAFWYRSAGQRARSRKTTASSCSGTAGSSELGAAEDALWSRYPRYMELANPRPVTADGVLALLRAAYEGAPPAAAAR